MTNMLSTLSPEEQQAIRTAQAKYQRMQYAKNPDKQKEYHMKYWLKKAKEMGITSQSKTPTEPNATITSEEQEVIRKMWRTYKKEWRKQNPEKEAEYKSRYWLKKAKEMGFSLEQSEEN